MAIDTGSKQSGRLRTIRSDGPAGRTEEALGLIGGSGLMVSPQTWKFAVRNSSKGPKPSTLNPLSTLLDFSCAAAHGAAPVADKSATIRSEQ
jgi:hypothetical protein